MSLKWGRGAEGVWWNILNKDGKEIPQFLTMDSEVLAANGGYNSKAETDRQKVMRDRHLLFGDLSMIKHSFMMTSGQRTIS